MGQVSSRLCALASVLLLAAGGTRAWTQGAGGRDELIQGMLRIVLENNPTLASQAALLRESEKLPALRGGIALTGMSLSLATSYYEPVTGSFRLYPAATLGTNLSIGDPARALNAYNLKKEREAARQEYLKLRNSLIADLLSTVREELKLAGRRESLEKLKAYLQDYSDLIDKQVRAGVAAPELDKLWDLKERLLGVEAEIEDAENQLGTMRLEAALRLAGDSWQELLELLGRLGG
jgi:outer membrane protein TolC